jgi:hypothetical protein
LIGDAAQSLPTTLALGITTYLTRGAALEGEAGALAAGLTPELAKRAGIAAAEKTAALVGASSEGAVGYAQQANSTQEQYADMPLDELNKSPAYQALIKDGYNPESARARLVADTAEQAGKTAGIVDAVTNLVGGRFLGKIIGEGGSIVKSSGKGALTEGITEAVQSPGEQFGENLAVKQNLNADQTLSQGLVESALQGFFGGALTGGTFSGFNSAIIEMERGRHNSQVAEVHKDALTQLDEIARSSLTKARAPEAFQQLIAEATKDGDVQDVYIDAQTLAQSGVVEQLAQVSPAIAEQYNDALQAGGSVRIPLDEYAAHIAGTDLNQGLIDHIKLDPNGLTFAESAAYQQTYQAEFNAQMERVFTENKDDEAFKASTNEVRDVLKEQLNTVGHTSPQVNDTYSTMASSYYAVRAAAMGITPKALYDQYPLKVTGESVTGGVLNQGGLAQTETPAFKGWFGNSQVVDAEGKPLVVYHGTDQSFDTFDGSAYFTDSNEKASQYSNTITPGAEHTPNVMPVYIALKKPKVFTTYATREEIQAVKAAGKHDGVIVKALGGGKENNYIAFNPEQIKSATGNNGNFDPNDPNILHQSAIDVQSTLREVTGSDAARLAAKDFLNTPLTNADSGLQASVSRSTLDKMLSQSSVKNSRQVQAHMKAVANLDKLFAIALERETRPSNKNPETIEAIHHFNAPMVFNSDVVNVHILVKEFKDKGTGARIYDVKAVEIANPVASGEFTASPNTSDNSELSTPLTSTPPTGFDARFARLVNDVKQGVLKQGNRGAYSPNANTISLLKNADLSTFLHELGHAFLSMDVDFASQLIANPVLSESEQEVVKDISTLFDWFGIQGDIKSQLDQWYAMTFEEQRAYHEKTAEGFEAYLFEGKAPSLELQPLFQKMRAWFINVYRNLTQYLAKAGDTLTPEVRSVFDRMLASTEQIKLAQHARSMMPLFESANQAGMTAGEYMAYQNLDLQATQDAIGELQARGLRDMKWLSNAKGKVLKKLQKEAASVRREVRSEVASEILSKPVYRAWAFLTAKPRDGVNSNPVPRKKSNPDVLDETQDNIFTAIAKLGGVNKNETIAEWGIDSKDTPQSSVFGKPVWRRDGGLSLDAMAELLAEHGYLSLDKNGKHDLRDFEDKFNEQLRGNKQVSHSYDYSLDTEHKPGENQELDNLGNGKLDLASLKEAYGSDSPLVSGLVNLRMTASNAWHQDIVAEKFKFSSGDEMVKALLEAQPPRQAVEDATDVRMLELHSDIASPEALERAADKAIHNDVRARMISTEINALAKATGKKAVVAKAAREFANGMVAKLKVRDIKPSQYTAAEARASKNAISAMRSGDLETAAAEKRNQLVSNYAAKAAHEARGEVESGVIYMRKFGKDSVRKGLDAEYLDQLDALLDRFDLRTGVSLKSIDQRDSMLDWINKQREQVLEPDIPSDLINEALRMSYKNMPLEAFRGLVESVKQIEHLGRLKHRLLTAKDQRAYEAIRDSIANSINENAGNREADTRTPTTNIGRKVQSLKNLWASHLKAATLARILDGGKDGGPVWEYIIRSANEAADYETTERGNATEALSNVLAPVFKLGKMGGKGQYFASINRSLNRESRLVIALNTGNASNLQRLLGGEGWTPQQIQPVLDTLSKDEWDAVQAIWDHFETYRPSIAAKERRVYGTEPKWIESSPVHTAHGIYRGGYYPVKYDPLASQRAEEHADAEGAKRQIQGAYTSATTRRTFVKTRVEEVKGRPLLYTLSGVYSGVNDMIHDLAWHEWLIDVNRLMRSSTIDAAIRNHYGPAVKRQFKEWIDEMAAGEKGAANQGEIALGYLRQSISIAGLGFNTISAALQVTGFTQSIVRIGPKWVGRGVSKYIASPIQSTRKVTELSGFMESRFRTQFRELNELRNQVQDQHPAKKAMQDSAYFLMTRVQQMVDVPTWLGAYEKAVSEGNQDDRAVALADQAVIDSQMSGMSKDLSAIERGGPALKLFTVFYSFMNTTFNLGVMRYMTEPQKAKLATDYLLLYVVTPVLGLAIKNAITPGDADDEWDMEALTKALLGESLSFMMGQMVIVREFAEAAKTTLGLSSSNMGYQGPAGVRVVADATKFAQQGSQGEFDDAFRKSSINLIGSLFGLPSAQLNRSITGAEALTDGDTDNPASVIFGYQQPH